MKDQIVLTRATEKLLSAYKTKKLDLDDLKLLCWYYLHRQIEASYEMREETDSKNQRQYILDTTLFFAHMAALTAINGEGE